MARGARVGVVLVAVTLIVGVLLWSFVLGGERPVRNVIVIVVDTLRADHIGVMDGPVDTPAIDRLANQGVLFTRARSHAPITGPSHASLLTGLYPPEHGVRNNTQLLEDRFTTLAELAAEWGMTTAAFVSLGVLKSQFGIAQGYQHYADQFSRTWWKAADEINSEVLPYLETLEPETPLHLWVHYSDPHEPYAPPDREYLRMRAVPERGELTVVECNGRVVRVPVELEDERGSVTFYAEQPEGVAREAWPVRMTGGKVWGGCTLEAGEGMQVIPHGDHSTLWAAEWPATVNVVGCDEGAERVNVQFEAIERDPADPWSRTAYADEVRFVDGEIGRLLAALETGGWLDDALVIFASDHGEGLGEHNLGGHINQLYDSLLHVPLILWAPGHVPAGVVVRQPVSLVDLLPTVAAMTGHDLQLEQRGRNLVPLIRKARLGLNIERAPRHGGWTAKPQAPHNLESWLSGKFKLIRNTDTGQRELYNVVDDPEELTDLSEKRPEVLQSVEAELEGLEMEEHSGSWEALDEKDLDRLRALGYVN